MIFQVLLLEDFFREREKNRARKKKEQQIKILEETEEIEKILASVELKEGINLLTYATNNGQNPSEYEIESFSFRMPSNYATSSSIRNMRESWVPALRNFSSEQIAEYYLKRKALEKGYNIVIEVEKSEKSEDPLKPSIISVNYISGLGVRLKN